MTKSTEFSDMKLASVLKEWMDEEGWKDDILVSEDRTAARVDTKFGINDQPHQMFLETDEDGELFSVYLYSPFNVPPARMADMSRILNRINGALRLGRLMCGDDEDSNPVQFKASIDVEGSKLAPRQIGNMASAAVSTFGTHGELLAAVALTKQPVETLWSSFLEEQSERDSAGEDERSEL